MSGFIKRIFTAAVNELGLVIGTEPLDATAFGSLDSQISELYDMYTGAATGKQLVRAIVRFKSSSIMNGGLSVKYNGEAIEGEEPLEVTYINSVLDYNNVNQGLSRKLIIASQIEGKVLVRVIANNDAKNEGAFTPKIIYLPLRDTAYKFLVDPQDPEKILSVSYKLGEVEVKDDPFDDYAFVNFNSLPSTTAGFPSMGAVIQEMKDIDEALQDWRKMNRNFAVSTPYFKCETLAEAKAVNEALQTNKWKRGNAMAGTSTLDLINGDAGDYESMSAEIVMKLQIVSAATGTPPQHMGLSRELSNRATAESMDKPAEEDSQADSDAWARFWERVFDISIRMNNESPTGTQGTMAINVVEPDTTGVTKSEYNAVKDVYLEMRKLGDLSRKTLWQNTPKIDSVLEKARLDEEQNGGLNDANA